MNIDEIPPLEDFNLPDVHFQDKVVHIEEALDKNKINIEHYSLGFPLFDEAMEGGLSEGDLLIISGISGEGKTTLAQTFTYNLCKNAVPCLWFSYEVSLEHLHKKFDSMGIADFYTVYVPNKLHTGKLSWIIQKIKESWIKHGTKVVFIDHIDFLIPILEQKTFESQALNLKQIATELKTIANELKMVIVCMTHLKKLQDGKEPDMQDIGYSAGIFQLSDYVMMIFREKNKPKRGMYEDQGEVASNTSVVKIVKNRHTGQLKFLRLQYQNGRFFEITNSYDEPSSGYNRYIEGISNE